MKPQPERLTFEHIKGKVERTYPNPIATAFRRYCHASSHDLTGRYKLLLDLFEVLVKFLCAIQLAEGREFVPGFTQALKLRSQTLDFLKKPMLGQWVGLLRELCEIDLKGPKPLWSQRISEWYLRPRDGDKDWAVDLFRECFNLAQKSTGPPISVICNSFTNPRNQFAHLPTRTEAKRKEFLSKIESVFAFILDSASFLGEGQLFVARDVSRTDDSQYRIDARLLNGVDDDEREFVYRDLLEPNWIYLTTSVDLKVNGPVIRLTPFFLWQHGDEKIRGQMFVLSSVSGNKLYYSSFVTGEPHEENSARFGSLLTDLTSLELQPDFNESSDSSLPVNVRSDFANTLYSRALSLIDYKYFGQALRCLKDAASYQKRPEILVKMATVMIELKERSEDIKQVLNQALDLDPENAEARRLLAALGENDAYRADEEHVDFKDLPLQKTVFHLFCPRRLKNHAITFWSVIILGWYSVSALAEFITGNPERAVATTLAMLCCLLVVFGAALLRPWAERLRSPLQRQLSETEMKEQRFIEWFDEQLRMIFESFSSNDKRALAKRNRRILYVVGLFWMISMVGGALYFSQSYLAPTPLMVKRLVDYFVLFAVLYPAVQYTIAITLFVYHFSHLALKPTLTKVSNDGVRHLGPFVAFSIVFGTLIYSLLHLSFAIGFTNPFRIDLLFLFVGTGITAVWTVAFPFQLRRSLQASKNFAILRYSGHVQDAFDKFVEEPTETNEKDYKRLLDNEKIIQKISVWPLSAAETIFVIGGSNLLLALVASAYVTHRLGLWAAVFRRFW
jgi:tetratricopeptide (TPR) repeat protein